MTYRAPFPSIDDIGMRSFDADVAATELMPGCTIVQVPTAVDEDGIPLDRSAPIRREILWHQPILPLWVVLSRADQLAADRKAGITRRP